LYKALRFAGLRAARFSGWAATADFEGDGRLEFVFNKFNDRPYFFANRFPRQNYLEVKLTGTTSNRDAIGAVAWLWTGNMKMVRQVNPAGGYLAQSSRLLHFGLGDRKADSLVVRWPSGGRAVVRAPKVNSVVSLTEAR
jgi:hypothetical protein